MTKYFSKNNRHDVEKEWPMGLPGLGEVESLKEGIVIANRQKGPAFATRKLLLRPDCLILLKQQSDRFVKKYDLNSIANVGPHKSQPKCLVVDRKGKLKSFKPLIWEFGSTEERNAWIQEISAAVKAWQSGEASAPVSRPRARSEPSNIRAVKINQKKPEPPVMTSPRPKTAQEEYFSYHDSTEVIPPRIPSSTDNKESEGTPERKTGWKILSSSYPEDLSKHVKKKEPEVITVSPRTAKRLSHYSDPPRDSLPIPMDSSQENETKVLDMRAKLSQSADGVSPRDATDPDCVRFGSPSESGWSLSNTPITPRSPSAEGAVRVSTLSVPRRGTTVTEDFGLVYSTSTGVIPDCDSAEAVMEKLRQESVEKLVHQALLRSANSLLGVGFNVVLLPPDNTLLVMASATACTVEPKKRKKR